MTATLKNPSPFSGEGRGEGTAVHVNVPLTRPSGSASPEKGEAKSLPLSLLQVLQGRGFNTPEHIAAFLSPALEDLRSPDAFPHMTKAIECLREAIAREEPIAIYADRDVDGLSGLAILLRTLRTLGGHVHWGSPLQGRGLEHAVLEDLVQTKKAKILILVDCGAGEETEITWLSSLEVKVIVADHHRLMDQLPPAFAWIHPGMMDTPSPGRRGDHPLPKGRGPTADAVAGVGLLPMGEGGRRPDEGTFMESPAGCVMAFKLAHALWLSFLGNSEPERLNYFLFDHLDLLCLGILADRMPLTGENRTFVWHGLRRMAKTRKAGLESLLRFFRLSPRTTPLTVREVTWQVIPMLNAAGRLGQPQWTADLLTTEDSWTARDCIDALMDLNSQRRSAQVKSVELFEKAVLDQCAIDTDPILVAIATGLEPSVTGLAAQALMKKYGRPAFLFVNQGDQSVGSARGTGEVDLFAWVEEHQDLLVKFGGHQGAVGMTLVTSNFVLFRERLLQASRQAAKPAIDISPVVEARVSLRDLDEVWWEHLQRLEPFGPGFPMPVFCIEDVDTITAMNKRKIQTVMLKAGSKELTAEIECGKSPLGEGSWQVVGYPKAGRKGEPAFKWIIQEVTKSHV